MVQVKAPKSKAIFDDRFSSIWSVHLGVNFGSKTLQKRSPKPSAKISMKICVLGRLIRSEPLQQNSKEVMAILLLVLTTTPLRAQPAAIVAGNSSGSCTTSLESLCGDVRSEIRAIPAFRALQREILAKPRPETAAARKSRSVWRDAVSLFKHPANQDL